MDHKLNDSLNMESAMSVDMDTDNVETQADIGLEGNGQDSMAMEFEDIQQQHILMDAGNEEVIVSDYMSGHNQFTLQVYDNNQTEAVADHPHQDIMIEQADGMMNLQYDSPIMSVPGSQAVLIPNRTMKYVTAEASTPQVQSVSLLSAPRQVAIAPKPQQSVLKVQKSVPVSKQYAIAPKPVTLSNRGVSLVKKVSLAGAMQANANGKPILAQIGKKLVMMPPGHQKIKLVTTPTVRFIGPDQAKLMASGTGTPKQVRKVIVQGTKLKSLSSQPSDVSSQSAVLTKVVSGAGSGQTPARLFTMHQKTVPITIGNNKIILTSSPSQQGVPNQQVMSIKSPTKVLPQQQGATPKKVVLTANPAQNVVVKSQPKAINVTSQASSPGQKTQLHRIEVPGKGVQYIQLVTGGASSKAAHSSPAPAPQSFVLTDNIVTPKPQQKLVRIAPVTSKTGKSVMAVRSGQSLLAPSQPAAPAHAPDMPDLGLGLDEHTYNIHTEETVEQVDSKASLQTLVADTERDSTSDHSDLLQQSSLEQPNSAHDQSGSSARSRPEEDHPLIVVPSFMRHEPEAYISKNDARRPEMSVEVDFETLYATRDSSPALSDTEIPQNLIRPRKACNCTKSQCLKLYCDCFANGEFCNRCNCHNCHNNLENEELRQKAIRGCLDRNPYAFRPKIGKAKAVGPEAIRRHNKGCNCKRSGCLKNYCECYEAKIACTSICKCVGCRNVEDGLEMPRRLTPLRHTPAAVVPIKQPCSFMTMEVIEAVCQCMVAAAADNAASGAHSAAVDGVSAVLDEFARCLQDIIGAAHHTAPLAMLHEAIA